MIGVRGWTLPVGTAEQFRWLSHITKWVLILNLLDGVFTLVWVEYFGAREMNFLMSDLVHTDGVLFMLVKLTLVSLGTVFLWRNRSNPLAVVSLFVAFFCYYLILLFHLQYASGVIFG